MGFKQQGSPDYRSIWVEGPPNSGKTYSLATLPRPLVVLSAPGEKGSASIPYGEGVTAYVWEDDGTPSKDRNTLYYMKQWREVEATVLAAFKEKPQAIVIDGAHKLYKAGLAVATDGESEKLQSAFTEVQTDKGTRLEGEFDPRCYGKAHRIMWEFVNLVAASAVPWRVFTSWAEQEKDDPSDKSMNGPSHIMPDLPGKAARQVLGEVSVVLHAMIDPKGQYVWQTKPGGKVWGAGVKGNAAVVAKLPNFIPQDFMLLDKYLCGEAKSV